MTSTPVAGTRWYRSRRLAQLLVAALAVTALVLTVMVWKAVAHGPSVRADSGELVPLRTEPYGRPVTLLLPGSEITVLVGPPVDRIDYEMLETEYDDPQWERDPDLVAPEDGRLVPVSWRVRALGGFGREGDPNPIEIRLVAGEQRIDLSSVVLGDTGDSLDAYEPRNVVAGVDGEVDMDDLAVEVEYDGVTQTAHVASDEIDAGVAQPLYDDDLDFTAGCTEVEDQCQFSAADPDSPVRPKSYTLTASYVTLYPYDATLGWADEGTLWAAVRLQLFGAQGVQSAAGDYWSVRRQTRPAVRLDGARPIRREGLSASQYEGYGRAVFRVDADAVPRRLTIDQVLTMSGSSAPAPFPVVARLDLTPVG